MIAEAKFLSRSLRPLPGDGFLDAVYDFQSRNPLVGIHGGYWVVVDGDMVHLVERPWPTETEIEVARKAEEEEEKAAEAIR